MEALQGTGNRYQKTVLNIRKERKAIEMGNISVNIIHYCFPLGFFNTCLMDERKKLHFLIELSMHVYIICMTTAKQRVTVKQLI